MKLLRRILGLDQRDKVNEMIKERREQRKGVPVNESLQFRTHLKTTLEEFAYLVDDLGFSMTENDWKSREYWIEYSKGPITVEIMMEAGSFPEIWIRNNDLPYDESRGLDNRDHVLRRSAEANGILRDRHIRLQPKRERFQRKMRQFDKIDFSELDKDYEKYGRDEHIRYLKIAAKVIREKLELEK